MADSAAYFESAKGAAGGSFTANRKRRGEEHPETKPVHAMRHSLGIRWTWFRWIHTPMDQIVVGPTDREPVGRPWLTVVIDTYSANPQRANTHVEWAAIARPSYDVSVASHRPFRRRNSQVEFRVPHWLF